MSTSSNKVKKTTIVGRNTASESPFGFKKPISINVGRSGNGGGNDSTISMGIEDGNDYDDYETDEYGKPSLANVHVCDLWYKKENAFHRKTRIVFMETLQALWYNAIVGIGFRMLGNSWSFGLLQGFAFTSMLSLFWYDDCGFANIFVTMGLCFTRQLRSKEKWIFFLHLVGQLIGGALAMGAIILVTNDLPGLQTFGTPTKGSLISEPAAGFAEFFGSFFVSFAIFFYVFRWKEEVTTHFKEERVKQEKKRKNRYYDTPWFILPLGLAYTAFSIGFYDVTGSSFNFLRWAIPRLCMGHFDLNTHDVLYYFIAHLFGVILAALGVYLLFLYKRKTEMNFLKNMLESDHLSTM